MSRERTRNAEGGTRNRGDRLRALNIQQLVAVTLDERGLPIGVRRGMEHEKRVESIGETWLIDDEWWRVPIVRRYVEVVLEGGGRVVLFEDASTAEWWMQKPA
jgi:hypothetical protein